MSDLPPPGSAGPVVDPGDPIGLCRTCAHGRQVPSRTTLFWMCGLASTDARFPRYPRLPVISCAGYQDAQSAGDRS
jgi:hypothetical protein